MRITKLLKAVVTIVTCAAMIVPHPALAAARSTQIVDGIQVSQSIKNVRLAKTGALRGAIVDQNGNPVAGAPVVVGQQGKIVAELNTAADGRYELATATPGVYQVASYAGVQTIRVHADNAPADSVDGVVQVIDQAGISRGQCCAAGPSCPGCDQCSGNRFGLLKRVATNPLTWAVVIAAAIAIPLALDDDDDAS
ncbi:hypothetical protein Poly24_20740 [Rosistilla carotiformis]|uniref:Nickel uptake substrate-specific transmembrane region n=1 Tax=Rosistilla carotiformis TaxID=2528017 RepID=A0A518JS64_9BACT|nr:carboxypeptidase-like regulatory domain-containing protein [Rosistilla carotiformis]QDV68365.1 hypothetical protein Poly24_20740 [Rosistilla carotiformis]